jgi:hypothetical protein
MPPEDRFICRFAAEPPQEGRPRGRWADRLRAEFLAACLKIDTGEDEIGEAGELAFHPDRTWSGRTYVPVTSRTSTGFDLYGYVAFTPGDPSSEDPDHREPAEFTAMADYTDETAEANPDWKLDLCDEVIGGWRGEGGRVAAMTLVWGRALTQGGAAVTAELADIVVDQCSLDGDRFTMLAPDAYRGDYLDVRLWSARGDELAAESLYDEDGDEDDSDED